MAAKRKKADRSYSKATLRRMKLRGRYMGQLNALTPRNRAKVKRVRQAKGIERAIAVADKLAD